MGIKMRNTVGSVGIRTNAVTLVYARPYGKYRSVCVTCYESEEGPAWQVLVRRAIFSKLARTFCFLVRRCRILLPVYRRFLTPSRKETMAGA
jgi:hypothetical protein